MNVLAVALTWVVAGGLGSLLLPRLRLRRLAALVPLAAAVAALVSLGSGSDLVAVAAPGGLQLGRPAGGLVLLGAIASTVFLLLSPPPDEAGVFTLAGCGALSALALASGSPLAWAVCLVAGFGLHGTRLVAVAPSRTTLAAARLGTFGSACLLAAAPFLPIGAASLRTRGELAGGLLAGGIAAGVALLPTGGWVSGVARVGHGNALAPWALLLLPALLLSAQPLQAALPASARSVFGFILLPGGAITAGWSAARGLAAGDSGRYVRVLLVDVGLVCMGLAAPEAGARLGSLLLVVTHLCIAPLLLQGTSLSAVRPRRLAWLALSGVPPGPAFWGRFALLTALTEAFGGRPLLVAVPATGAILLVALRAAIAAAEPGPAAHPQGPATRLAAWLPPLAAVTLGLVPQAALRALFGTG